MLGKNLGMSRNFWVAAVNDFRDRLLRHVSICNCNFDRSKDVNSTVLAPKTPLSPQSVITAFLNKLESIADSYQVNSVILYLQRARYAFMSAKRDKMKDATKQTLISETFRCRSVSHTVPETENNEDWND